MKLGFASLLTLIFITLKLTHVIAWSWLWVLAPAWISFTGAILLLLFIIACGAKVQVGGKSNQW